MKQVEPAQYHMVKQKDGKLVTDNRFQDLLYEVEWSENGVIRRVLLALEIQCRQEWDMVVRVQSYNYRQNQRQAKYGALRKDHKILPIYNLVINFSDSPWREATSIHELYPYQDDGISNSSVDFHFYLLDAWLLDEKILASFFTDLGYVLYFRVHSKDAGTLFKDSMKLFPNIVLKNDAIDLLNVFFHVNLDYPEPEEEYTVCKAVRDFRKQIIAEGKAAWLKEGIEKGLKQGVQQGLKQGVQQGLKQGVQQGLKQGVQQGLKQGRAECRFDMLKQFVQACLLNGISRQETAKKLTDIFNATDAEIELLFRPAH